MVYFFCSFDYLTPILVLGSRSRVGDIWSKNPRPPKASRFRKCCNKVQVRHNFKHLYNVGSKKNFPLYKCWLYFIPYTKRIPSGFFSFHHLSYHNMFKKRRCLVKYRAGHTSQLSRLSVTILRQKIVTYRITAKYVDETLFWIQE